MSKCLSLRNKIQGRKKNLVFHFLTFFKKKKKQCKETDYKLIFRNVIFEMTEEHSDEDAQKAAVYNEREVMMMDLG